MDADEAEEAERDELALLALACERDLASAAERAADTASAADTEATEARDARDSDARDLLASCEDSDAREALAADARLSLASLRLLLAELRELFSELLSELRSELRSELLLSELLLLLDELLALLDELLELLPLPPPPPPWWPSTVHQVMGNSPRVRPWNSWKRDMLISSEPWWHWRVSGHASITTARLVVRPLLIIIVLPHQSECAFMGPYMGSFSATMGISLLIHLPHAPCCDVSTSYHVALPEKAERL